MGKRLIIIPICLILSLTGCWDKMEIDKTVFVTVMAIDKLLDEEEMMQGRNDGNFPEVLPNRYRILYGYPNTGMFAGKTEGEPRYTVVSTGVNMLDIEKNISTRLGGAMNFDHTKLVILGEELAKDSRMLREVLDYIERSPEIGRKIHLMVTPGEAQQVAEAEIDHQPPILGLYIRDIMEKTGRIARSADADFGYILRTLHESSATIIPRIQSGGKEVKVAGAGVIKDYKLVGWLGEMETLYLMFMLDRVDMSSGNIQLEEDILSVITTYEKTDMKVFQRDGEIIVAFDVEMEGALRQHLFMVKDKPLDDEYLKDAEKKVEKVIEERIVATYNKIKDEYGADLVQVGEYLRKHEPDLWESIKGDWDDIYPQTKIEVNVDMNIRRVGSTK